MHLKSKRHIVAIVGINRESAGVLSALIETQSVKVIRIINDETEDVGELKKYPQLDIIINTTNDASVYRKLKQLNLENVDILSGLSGRILFSAGTPELPASDNSEDKNRLLNSLHEIREAIYLSKNREQLMRLVLSVAIRSSQADSGSIMLLDAAKRTLTIEIAEGLKSTIVASTVQKVGKGIAGVVAKTGKPLLIKGAADRQRYAADYERKDLVSSICAPLIIGREIVGVLSVNSTNKQREFAEKDLLYVKKLADFTADIIKTSKEYEHNSASAFSLSLLNNARDIFTLKYSINERLNLLLLKMVNAFHGEICNYYDYVRDKKAFLAKASSSFNIKLIKGKKLKLNDFFTKQVVASEETVFQSVPEKDGFNKRWYIAAPVKVNGEMLGLIFLHLISSKDGMQEEIALLEKIAEMVGSELAKNQEMESIRGQSIKFSAISEVSFDLAAARTMSELSNIIISNVCMIMEAESSVLRIYNQQLGTLDVLDSFSLKSFDFLKKLDALDVRISNDVITQRRSVLIKYLEKSPYAVAGIDIQSALCMFLERSGKILGTLSLYDKKSIDLYATRSFSNKDREIFLNFCLQASKALDRFIIDFP